MPRGNRDELVGLVDSLGKIKAQMNELGRIEKELVAQVKDRLDPGEEYEGKHYRASKTMYSRKTLDTEKLIEALGEEAIEKFRKTSEVEQLTVKPYTKINPRLMPAAPAPVAGAIAGE